MLSANVELQGDKLTNRKEQVYRFNQTVAVPVNDGLLISAADNFDQPFALRPPVNLGDKSNV